MTVENRSCHPTAVIRHAMDANPAIGLRQVEIAHIAVKFPIIAASVRCQRIARELVESLNLSLQLFDRNLFHRGIFFLLFKVGTCWQSPPSIVSLLTLASNASGFVIYFWRLKGSLARILISRSDGPPNAPLVTAMAMPSKATRARARKKSDAFMPRPFP